MLIKQDKKFVLGGKYVYLLVSYMKGGGGFFSLEEGRDLFGKVFYCKNQLQVNETNIYFDAFAGI